MKIVRVAALVVCCLLLAGCGGGGGSGGDSSANSGTFTLDTNTATFSVYQGDVVPSSTSLKMTITGPNVAYAGAAYTGGQTQPSWLGISMNGSGSNYTVVISISQTDIAPGQYSSTFYVGTADSSGKVLQSQEVTVKYTVTARITFIGADYSNTFIYGDTTTQANVPLQVVANGRSWSAESDSAWLKVLGTTLTGSATINVTVDVSALSPGNYEGNIIVRNLANSGDFGVRKFTITIQAPVLHITQTQLLLGGLDGVSSSAQALNFSISSGAAQYPYFVSAATDSGGTWLRADVNSGAVGASGVTTQVSASRGSLVGGTYTGQLTVKVTIRDLTLTELVPVTYNVEASRLVVAASGVGFSSQPIPARSVLSRTVNVFSSIGRTDIQWSATSDSSWLSVTASGQTGQAMTLSADPAGLSTDVTHFANVTVRSSDPNIENEQVIRVGLYVSSTIPADLSNIMTAQFLASSPVEPLVFISDGGTDVFAYNVYTGELAHTFSGVVANAGAMAVADDGQRLYVHDRNNFRVTEINVANGSVVRNYAATLAGYGVTGGAVGFIRPAGYSTIVTPAGRVYDTGNGTEYSGVQAPTFASSLAGSSNGAYLATDDGNLYTVKRTALMGGGLSFKALFNTGTAGGRAGQACISWDNTMIYTASGAPYDFRGTSILTQQLTQVLPGTNYPDAVLCLWDDVVIGGVDGYYANYDVWIYKGSTGQQLALRSSSTLTNYRSLVPRGMAASADATRLITLTRSSFGDQAQEVRFQSIPAP